MADLPLNDISYAQPFIDWNILKDYSNGVIIRSGQGIYEDTFFREHYKNSVSVNLMRGIFHFHQPNQMGTPQVEFFLTIWNSLIPKPKRCFLDVEDISYYEYNEDGSLKGRVLVLPPNKEYHTLALMQWCDRYHQATGNALGFYTRADYWNTWVIPSNTDFYYGGVKYTTPDWSKNPLWIASWYNYIAGDPRLPRDWSDWTIHQYEGGTGRTKGILDYWGNLGPVDQNRFNGTKDEMLAFFDAEEVVKPMTILYNQSVPMKDRAKILTLLPNQKLNGITPSELGIDAVILPIGSMSEFDGSHWKVTTEATFPARCDLFANSKIPVFARFDLNAGAMVKEQHTAPEFENRVIRDNWILPKIIDGWHIGTWSWDTIFSKKGKWRNVSAIILSLTEIDGFPPGTLTSDDWQVRIFNYVYNHLVYLMDNGMAPNIPVIIYSGGWWFNIYKTYVPQLLSNLKTKVYLQMGQWVRTSTNTFNSLAEIFAFPPDETFKFEYKDSSGKVVYTYPDGYFERILMHEFSGEAQKVKYITDANGTPTPVSLSLWNDTKDSMYKLLNFTGGSTSGSSTSGSITPETPPESDPLLVSRVVALEEFTKVLQVENDELKVLIDKIEGYLKTIPKYL